MRFEFLDFEKDEKIKDWLKEVMIDLLAAFLLGISIVAIFHFGLKYLF